MDMRRSIASRGFEVVLRLAGKPDEDLVFISSAKYFVENGGGFTRIAKRLISMNEGELI